LALAEGLAQKGADITIVARDVKKLEQAVERIKASFALFVSISSYSNCTNLLPRIPCNRIENCNTGPDHLPNPEDHPDLRRPVPIQTLCQGLPSIHRAARWQSPGLCVFVCGSEQAEAFRRDGLGRFHLGESAKSASHSFLLSVMQAKSVRLLDMSYDVRPCDILFRA
jgi:hypothetical protein